MPRSGKVGIGTAPVSAGKPVGQRKLPAKKAALCDIADTLYGVALNACRQHQKYAELVDRNGPEAEQKGARSAVRACDEVLDEAVDLYEVACLGESNHADDAWWHRANMVWRTAREYLTRHAATDRLTRGANDHRRAELVELNIEYELDASALLRLRHAIDSYRAARPEAG